MVWLFVCWYYRFDTIVSRFHSITKKQYCSRDNGLFSTSATRNSVPLPRVRCWRIRWTCVHVTKFWDVTLTSYASKLSHDFQTTASVCVLSCVQNWTGGKDMYVCDRLFTYFTNRSWLYRFSQIICKPKSVTFSGNSFGITDASWTVPKLLQFRMQHL
jgi:hypothetical protein